MKIYLPYSSAFPLPCMDPRDFLLYFPALTLEWPNFSPWISAHLYSFKELSHTNSFKFLLHTHDFLFKLHSPKVYRPVVELSTWTLHGHFKCTYPSHFSSSHPQTCSFPSLETGTIIHPALQAKTLGIILNVFCSFISLLIYQQNLQDLYAQ